MSAEAAQAVVNGSLAVLAARAGCRVREEPVDMGDTKYVVRDAATSAKLYEGAVAEEVAAFLGRYASVRRQSSER